MISYLHENKKQIWQFIRLSFYSGIIFVVAVVLIVSILAYIYRDAITESFIRNVNKNLKTEIHIEEIRINALRNFPFVSLSLKNVRMMETGKVSKRDTLLFAQRIYFQFSIMDLIRKNYSVKQLEIARASIHLKIFPDQSNNFTFWESSSEQNSDQEFAFLLQKVTFNQVDFSYTDFLNRNYIGAVLNKAEMQGNFSQSTYLMKLNGDVFINDIIIDEMSLIAAKPLSFDLGLDVSNNSGFYFRQGHFNLAGNAFLAEGLLEMDQQHVDMRFSGKNLKLENILNILPQDFSRYLVGYRSNGELYFDALLQGKFSTDANPNISANFGIKSGELYHSKSKIRFRNVNFDAAYNNGRLQNLSSSSIKVTGLNAILNNGTFRADGTVVNFTKPQVDVKLFSDIEAGDWYRFFMIDTLKSASGNLLIDISYKGGLGVNGKFTSRDFLGSNVSGIVKANNVSFSLKNDPLQYHSFAADFVFNNNDIAVKDFSGFASGSDFNLKGSFRNVLPWLFLENEKIIIDASFTSQNLNFNELLQYSVNETDTTYKLKLSDKVDFQLTANIGKLNFKKFEANSVKGKLSMRNQVFFAEDISFASMQGRVTASGFINGQRSDKLLIGCEANVYNVDVYEMFYQLGNFGQQGIVADNLRGRATSALKFKSEWSPTLDIEMNSLEITADIKIENGELINYEPMLALSRFLRVGDLKHVKFSTLENQIRLKDNKIIIPDMEINSNALNIKISGEHTLEHDIHYRLQVLLSELLARRNRQSRNPQEQYGDIIDDGLGRTTLFLLVSGTIDEPVFRYDRQGVREKLRDDFRKERQTMRDVLRTEFGAEPQPLNESVPISNRPAQNEIKKREEGRFIIEWE
jgi:hypothetical protein